MGLSYVPIVSAALLVVTVSAAVAQTQPATTQAVRRELVLPLGFKVVDAGGRRVVAEAGDEAWVKKAMTELAPATRPTTAPSDLVEKLAAKRGELTRQMVADLALADPKPVDQFFEKAVAEMGRYEGMKPPVFYLVTTRQKLLALVKGGWEDPRYYYNKAADEVMIETGMRLSVEREMDDMLLPALYLEDAPAEARTGVLQRIVQQTERMTADEIARRAQMGLQVMTITFIVDEVFRPMQLKPGQDWFAVGVSGVLAADYATQVIGLQEGWVVRQMTAEPPRTPVKSIGVDLLKPADLSALREQIVPFYLDAVRRKSTAAVKVLVEKTGRGGVAKVIAKLRQGVPADGAGLVTVIKEQTGVDLAEQVRAAK